MNRILRAIVLVMLPVSLFAGIDDWVSVVKVTDNFKNSSYEILSNKDYTARVKAIWHRNRMLNRAIRLARDEWHEAEDTKDKVYPVNVTCKAEAKRLKTFPDAEKAQEYISVLEAEDAKRSDESESRTYFSQKIELLEEEVKLARERRQSRQRNEYIRIRLNELEVLRKDHAERLEKERARKAMDDQAQSLIKGHLDALVAEFEQPNYENPQAF